MHSEVPIGGPIFQLVPQWVGIAHKSYILFLTGKGKVGKEKIKQLSTRTIFISLIKLTFHLKITQLDNSLFIQFLYSRPLKYSWYANISNTVPHGHCKNKWFVDLAIAQLCLTHLLGHSRWFVLFHVCLECHWETFPSNRLFGSNFLEKIQRN